MPYLGKTTPYYGGGQVPNPSNVYQVKEPPAFQAQLGSIAVDFVHEIVYIASGTDPKGRTIWLPMVTEDASSWPITPYVVGIEGQAGYQTIQSAIDAAIADIDARGAASASVYIQAGRYTENLTIPLGITLVGVTSQGTTGDVIIEGNHTFGSGDVERSIGVANISFSYNGTGVMITLAQSGVDLTFVSCTFNYSNDNYCIDATALVRGIVRFTSCDDTSSFAYGIVNGPNGGEYIFDSCYMGFTNPSANNGPVFGGSVSLANTSFTSPLNLVGSAICNVDNPCAFFNSIVLSNSASFTDLNGSYYSSNGDVPAITLNSDGNIHLYNCRLITINNPIIGGTGSGSVTLYGCMTSSYNIFGVGISGQINGLSSSAQFTASDDLLGGPAGTVSLTGATSLVTGAGVGSIRMSGANNAPSSGFIKIYVADVPYWVPVWTNPAP